MAEAATHLPLRRFRIVPAVLGRGGEGPWEDRCDLTRSRHPHPAAVGGYLNEDLSVQVYQHPEHPGLDHLLVRWHDERHEHPGWGALQRIKDELAPSGVERFGLEVYPPAELMVDNCALYHLWVMPLGWQPGFGIHEGQEGAVHV